MKDEEVVDLAVGNVTRNRQNSLIISEQKQESFRVSLCEELILRVHIKRVSSKISL